MRYIVLTLALLGAAASAGWGYIWLGVLREKQPELDRALRLLSSPLMAQGGVNQSEVRDSLAAVNRLKTATYLLLAAGPLGVLGGILALMSRGNWGALLLLGAGVGPVIFMAMTGLATSVLILGGLLSFLVQPRVPRAVPA